MFLSVGTVLFCTSLQLFPRQVAGIPQANILPVRIGENDELVLRVEMSEFVRLLLFVWSRL